ncbi:diguanylate cyclase (GGDEF)-like protein/PAS domain S-box-containing protein [Bacillus sp. SORGH_AS 510]|uniref:sensor domain-containing protein n=1 Tax=Bacillus sp. SORGH_AS_0510 TaxID=3041771 RepID=UPI00277E63F5|nr:EAL domain-containing protein [Bacillus sp. SORGH_AS_0510]MDQ1145648.1 diguanylate cyclase (GGDEF)-like protein/PAS domain S-box-containing protein [Bacillus sp. SORGH_AS_0510]
MMEEISIGILDVFFIFLLCIVVIFCIITTKRFSKQKKQLQLNEQYYKSLFEQNPDVVITFDLNGMFISANKAVSTIFGYSLDDLINKPFVPLIVPNDLEKALFQFNSAVNGKSTNYECSVFDKSGKQRKINVTNIPIYLSKKITGVYSIIKDITEHNSAQINLIEAEAKYRSLVENSQVGVYILQGGKIVYVNPRLCEMTGYAYNEFIGFNLTNLILPEDLPSVQENVEKLFTNEMISMTDQFRIVCKDKRIVSLEVFGSKIEYEGKDAIIGTIIDITDRKNTEQMIKHMAYHDQLTDLPNRYLLREKVDELIRESSENNNVFAILFLDLDRFKIVNDTMGHEIGDKLLIEVSARLRDCLDEKDIISRYGGDEFTILLPQSNVDQAREVAKSILTSLSNPLQLNYHEVFVTPSIGISMFPDHGFTYDKLIKHADLAMYFAKSLGKNNFQFYSDDLVDQSQYELDLEIKLRKALERNEFILYYQPQFNLHTNQIIGAEALIRWEHPEKGLISPAEFIPVAEETGLIIQLGEWALRTACYQNKKWQDEGLPPITIAVNISAKQFFQSNLAEIVEKILFETGLEAKYLELEITESMTMDVDRAITTLVKLKKIGVKVSMDDFGTGYSSLNYLKRFPIDKLKVDQSFIRDSTTDPNDETIVKTIIAMAHNLKLQVIAEGVETKEHVYFLLEQKCTEAQGYFFSKPVSTEEFEKIYFIAENQR